jgi:hypothetical protein
MNDDIAEAKRRLPLPDLMARCGLGGHAKKSARCPFHEDSNASFSVWQGNAGWRWKCHSGCGNGDEVKLLEKHEGLTRKDAFKRYLEMAGVGGKPESTSNGRVNRAPFDWKTCVNAFTDEDAAKLARWRGYSPPFVKWFRDNALVGLHEGCIAFPVHSESGDAVAAHYRLKADGSWRFEPKGSRVRPLVIGDLTTARMVHAFESQWDALAVCDKLNMHTTPGYALLVTRGAENGGLVAGRIRPDAELYAWPQNDPEDKRKNGKTPAEKWLATVAESAGCRVRSVLTPPEHKDANDWTRAGATDDDLIAAVKAATVIAERARPLIEFRMPSELRAFEPPAGSVLVGDNHIVKGSVFVIGGAPGVGKSRAGTGLAEAGATGHEWFGLRVHRRYRTMIVQNENGEHRLKDEYSELNTELLDPWVRVCPPPPLGMAFNNPEFRAALERSIADFMPDVVLVDPWNAVARDDKAADYLETFRIVRSVIPAGANAPALGIVAHTRKPKSDERATGRGLLNLLAGSYVLGSVPRCVFVLQAASDDPVDRRVVWTCCKNNDGELGPRSAWVRCNGLFEPLPDFDWESFDTPGNRKAASYAPAVEIVRDADEPPTKAQTVAELKKRGVAQPTAYRWIDAAMDAGELVLDPQSGALRVRSHS